MSFKETRTVTTVISPLLEIKIVIRKKQGHPATLPAGKKGTRDQPFGQWSVLANLSSTSSTVIAIGAEPSWVISKTGL